MKIYSLYVFDIYKRRIYTDIDVGNIFLKSAI